MIDNFIFHNTFFNDKTINDEHIYQAHLHEIHRFLKIVSNCDKEKSFKTYFGELKNLSELKQELIKKGDEFYFTYVNSNENHFANWIENVFFDKVLANDIKKAKNSIEAIEKINNRLKYADLWLNYNKDIEFMHYIGLKFYENYINTSLNAFNLGDNYKNLIQNNLIQNNLNNNNYETLKNVEPNKNFLTNADFTSEIEKSGIIKKKIIPPPPLIPYDYEKTNYDSKEILKNDETIYENKNENILTNNINGNEFNYIQNNNEDYKYNNFNIKETNKNSINNNIKGINQKEINLKNNENFLIKLFRFFRVY